MCEESASITVDRDGVEGACNECEVLSISLLTRPRLDHSRSCKQVNSQTGNRTNTGRAITPFMFNKEEYRVSICYKSLPRVLNIS